MKVFRYQACESSDQILRVQFCEFYQDGSFGRNSRLEAQGSHDRTAHGWTSNSRSPSGTRNLIQLPDLGTPSRCTSMTFYDDHVDDNGLREGSGEPCEAIQKSFHATTMTPPSSNGLSGTLYPSRSRQISPGDAANNRGAFLDAIGSAGAEANNNPLISP